MHDSVTRVLPNGTFRFDCDWTGMTTLNSPSCHKSVRHLNSAFIEAGFLGRWSCSDQTWANSG